MENINTNPVAAEEKTADLQISESGVLNIGKERQAKNSMDMINFLRVVATMFVFLLHGRSDIVGIDEPITFFSVITCFPAWAGVWILLFLSGYLMQKGFSSSRYQVFEGNRLSIKKLLKFYLGRFMRIAPAYYIYLILFEVLRRGAYFSGSPEVALKIFTFTFNGIGGISGIGHLWYLSIVMWMYALSPFFDFLFNKIKKLLWIICLFALVALVGLGLRLYISKTDLSWYEYVYTFFPMNLDLFICGMLACVIVERVRKINEKSKKCSKLVLTILKCASLVLFFTLTFYNCYIYCLENQMFVYQNVLPTVYVLSCALLLFAFDTEKIEMTKPDFSQIKRNPLRLIDKFSPYTYGFYIFHIAALCYIDVNIKTFDWFVNLPLVARYFIYFALGFALSLFLSVIFTKMISVFKLKKIEQKKNA